MKGLVFIHTINLLPKKYKEDIYFKNYLKSIFLVFILSIMLTIAFFFAINYIKFNFNSKINKYNDLINDKKFNEIELIKLEMEDENIFIDLLSETKQTYNFINYDYIKYLSFINDTGKEKILIDKITYYDTSIKIDYTANSFENGEEFLENINNKNLFKNVSIIKFSNDATLNFSIELIL